MLIRCISALSFGILDVISTSEKEKIREIFSGKYQRARKEGWEYDKSGAELGFASEWIAIPASGR
jgi:hypothetical protein